MTHFGCSAFTAVIVPLSRAATNMSRTSSSAAERQDFSRLLHSQRAGPVPNFHPYSVRTGSEPRAHTCVLYAQSPDRTFIQVLRLLLRCARLLVSNFHCFNVLSLSLNLQLELDSAKPGGGGPGRPDPAQIGTKKKVAGAAAGGAFGSVTGSAPNCSCRCVLVGGACDSR